MDDKLTKNNLLAKWLNNRLNDDDKKVFDESGELDSLKVVINEVDTWQVKEFDVEAGLKDLNRRNSLVNKSSSEKNRIINFNNWLSIAASIVICITTGYFSWNYFLNQEVFIKTQIAENKTIKLPNGSIIKMDALSEIKYSKKNWSDNRIVHLSGQAYFDVTKGDFTVKTKKGNISVLGTQFNVNTKNNKFEVACYEGKVKVSYKAQNVILTPGKSVKTQQQKLIPNTHTNKNPSWVNGYSKYNKAKLSKVVTDIQNRYQVNIKLAKKHQDLEFTGTITHTNLNTALKTLFNTMEIEYSVNNKRVILK